MKLDGWNSYFCNVNGELSSVFLDLDLFYKAPMKEYPKLCWYWIKMKNPREDGLSSDADFKELCEHQDAFEESIKKFKTIYVGRITTQGMRQFYFYSSNDKEAKEILRNFVGERPVFQYQIGEKLDTQWNQYLNLLYPSEHGIQQIHDKSA